MLLERASNVMGALRLIGMGFEMNQKSSRELGKKGAVGRENGANNRWKRP